jgi:hypothetical protein
MGGRDVVGRGGQFSCCRGGVDQGLCEMTVAATVFATPVYPIDVAW